MHPSDQTSDHAIQEALSAMSRKRAGLMPALDALNGRLGYLREAVYFTSRRPIWP